MTNDQKVEDAVIGAFGTHVFEDLRGLPWIQACALCLCINRKAHKKESGCPGVPTKSARTEEGELIPSVDVPCSLEEAFDDWGENSPAVRYLWEKYHAE